MLDECDRISSLNRLKKKLEHTILLANKIELGWAVCEGSRECFSMSTRKPEPEIFLQKNYRETKKLRHFLERKQNHLEDGGALIDSSPASFSREIGACSNSKVLEDDFCKSRKTMGLFLQTAKSAMTSSVPQTLI